MTKVNVANDMESVQISVMTKKLHYDRTRPPSKVSEQRQAFDA